MNYLVDTNVFLRVLYKEDSRLFEESAEFLTLLKQNRINAFTSSLVLAEVDWVLSSVYKVSKVNRVKSLNYIRLLNGLKVKDSVNFTKALDYYKNNNIKFVDCLLSSKIEKDTIVVSYDKDFDKIKGVVRKTPGQVVKSIKSS